MTGGAGAFDVLMTDLRARRSATESGSAGVANWCWLRLRRWHGQQPAEGRACMREDSRVLEDTATWTSPGLPCLGKAQVESTAAMSLLESQRPRQVIEVAFAQHVHGSRSQLEKCASPLRRCARQTNTVLATPNAKLPNRYPVCLYSGPVTRHSRPLGYDRPKHRLQAKLKRHCATWADLSCNPWSSAARVASSRWSAGKAPRT
jgi:hypothetical protein